MKRLKKKINSYYVINWDFNHDNIEFYDVMPYFIDCWITEKKRRHKLWNRSFTEEDKNIDDTKMPETFDEIKKFILDKSMYTFWARCEYEVIVTGWPTQKREHKLDIHQQIKANIDAVANMFILNFIQCKNSF